MIWKTIRFFAWGEFNKSTMLALKSETLNMYEFKYALSSVTITVVHESIKYKHIGSK